jgi:hypothetical protein
MRSLQLIYLAFGASRPLIARCEGARVARGEGAPESVNFPYRSGIAPVDRHARAFADRAPFAVRIGRIAARRRDAMLNGTSRTGAGRAHRPFDTAFPAAWSDTRAPARTRRLPLACERNA